MSAPRGDDFLFAPLGAGRLLATRTRRVVSAADHETGGGAHRPPSLIALSPGQHRTADIEVLAQVPAENHPRGFGVLPFTAVP